MTLKIRRLIFYSLIIIFLISAFITIPYSNGWHFDIKTLSFVKLGGLYLEIKPSDTKITIDKLNVELKTGFMKSGILVANLFPKKYHVSVEKDSYQSWNKNVAVKPSLVTRVYPIILLPQKLNMEILVQNALDIFPESSYLAWKDENKKLKIGNRTIKGTDFIFWLTGNKFALTYDEKTKNYFTVNILQNNTALNINLIFDNLKYQKTVSDNSKIEKIIRHPFDKNKLILATAKSLYNIDFNKPSLEIIKIGKYNLLDTGSEEIFFSDASNLYSYNLNKKEVLTILNQKADSAEISSDGRFLAVSNENKLVLIDRNNSDKPKMLMENIVYFKFSPDSKKIAAVNNDNRKINIFFIGDDYELFNKKLLSSSVFEIGLLDKDLPISWHASSAYIFLKNSDNLNFLEIDNNPPINLQTVDNGIEKYFYDQKNDLIYLIKNKTVYKISE